MAFRKLINKEHDFDMGQRIRRIRRSQTDLSMKSLGASVGISCQQMQRYEMGQDTLSVHGMKLVADSLGVSPCKICGCKDA